MILRTIQYLYNYIYIWFLKCKLNIIKKITKKSNINVFPKSLDNSKTEESRILPNSFRINNKIYIRLRKLHGVYKK